MVDGLPDELSARVWDKLLRNGIDARNRAIPRHTEGVPDRVNKVKSLGNAIVPQVPYDLFRYIDNILRH